MPGRVARTVEFPAEVAAELEAAARAADRSLSAQIRVAVAEHLANRGTRRSVGVASSPVSFGGPKEAA